MSEAPVEVAQKLNLSRLVQATVDAVHAARHPYPAALALCRLYTVLEPMRGIDQDFEDAWSQILNGRFLAYTSSRRGATRLRWHHIWAAEAALLSLMERHGMGFQANLPDQNETDFADLVAELEHPDPHEANETQGGDP